MTLSFASKPSVTVSPVKLPGTEHLIYPRKSLAEYTTYRVGGEAEWYAAPRDRAGLFATFDWLHRQQMPLTVLGAGSNLLISDHGIPGLVLSTRHLRQSHFEEATGRFTAAAGEPLAKVAWQAAKRGWKGLEWAVGIPGTIGGAVVMNAGAHNQSTSETLVSATVLSPTGQLEVLNKQDLGFSYRTSRLQGDNYVVLDATFQLQPGFSRDEIMTQTTVNLHQRKNSQPYDKPSCGSVFRNPTPQYAAKLIEELGLKGHAIGGAEVSHRHANFILNLGNAKAQDIFNLIFHVQETVHKNCSLLLEPEVKILGQFSSSY